MCLFSYIHLYIERKKIDSLSPYNTAGVLQILPYFITKTQPYPHCSHEGNQAENDFPMIKQPEDGH